MMEIRNPAKLPTDLNLAEKKFARCLAAGERCTIGDGELPKKRIESGDGVNVVRGEVIRFFAYGGNEENSVSGSIISLHGAWISGELLLVHASIPYALMFINCHFVASVTMPYTECVELSLNGSRLTQGLLADGLTTKNNVNLQSGFSAEGEVRLLGANIGGDLDCVGGKFHNPKKHALIADKMTTKSNVNFRDGFSAEGEVRLVGADIGGDLTCRGGKFHNSGGRALSADGLITKDNVNLNGDFSAKGEVRLLSANIGRNLNCSGGKFHNPNMCALNVNGGKIMIGLLWQKTICEGGVNLAYARADVLADDSGSWKSCKVDLDGFTYTRFANPMDAQSRIGWLAKRPDEKKFSPLPYEQAAKVLFGMGHVHDAREILLKKERLLTERGNFPWMWRQGRKIWDVLAGYGYRPWLHTFLISLGIMTIGSGLFCWGEQAGRIVPHQPAALVSMKYQYGRIPAETPDETVARKFSGYPEFSPILFSVDIFVPFLNLHQEPFWYPAPDGGYQHWWGSVEDGNFSRGGWLERWYWFQIIAGWVLTSLFLLSVTGLLRPRQSSGEKD